MEEIYKEWCIKYHEVGWHDDKHFIAKKGENEITGKTLKEIKTAIDKHAKKAFKRIPCFYTDYHKIVEAEITSIYKTDSEGKPKGVYISIKGGTTRKIEDYYFKNIYKHTEKNKQLFKEIHDLEVAISKLNEEKATKNQAIEKIELTTGD